MPFISFKVFPYKRIIGNLGESKFTTLPVDNMTSIDWLLLLYMIGLFLSLVYFLYKIVKIIVLINNTKFKDFGRYRIARNQLSTFSFFKYIFLENEDDLILKHEIAHSSKYHTLDILIFELAKSFLWFNPFVYIIGLFIRENHEFEADYIAMHQKSIDEIRMAEYLLNYSRQQSSNQFQITNNFFSLTKNRIKMLSKNKSTNKIAYAMIVPIFMVIFSAFTFKSYPVYQTVDGKILHDTLVPGVYFEIDSVVTYDPDTYEEYITVVKSEIPMDEYLKRFNFSGKLSSRIDTVPFYDPDTYEESLMVYKVKYPYELRFVFDKFSWKQQDAIIKHYGSMKKIKVK